MKTQTIFIYALAVVILYILYKRFGSSSNYGKEYSIGDVQDMMNSGKTEDEISDILIKSGVNSDVAKQMVINARTPVV
jgi:hypothetical protein